MDSQEIWRPIVCQDIHEGWYEVSNKGRVRSASTKRLLSPFFSKGYMRIGLMTYERHQQKFPVHRLVAMAFVEGYSEERHFVNHINGNKLCNEAYNLEWVTASENTIHAIRTGLLKVVTGERNGHASVSEIEARRICEVLVETNGDVPLTFNIVKNEGVSVVSSGMIYHIRNKGTWINVSDEYFQKEDFGEFNETVVSLSCNGSIRIFETIGMAVVFLHSIFPEITVYDIYQSIKKLPSSFNGIWIKYY